MHAKLGQAVCNFVGLVSRNHNRLAEAEVPGAFIFLGACPPEINYETAEVNHSNKARYDDAVLPEAAALLAALAFDTLNSR